MKKEMAEMTEGERLVKLETKDRQRDEDIHCLKEDVKEIKDKLLSRPSWAVTIIITTLSTLTISLLVVLMNAN